MLQRVGISMDDGDLQHIKLLQKRFGVRSRSKFFRELIKRYEQLESQVSALSQCVEGYIKTPESHEKETRALLRSALKKQPAEEW